MEFKFGADPEYFASKVINDKSFCVPPLVIRRMGFPLVKEDEKHPQFKIVDGIGGEIIIHEDGAAFELSVPASKDMKTVWKNCKMGQEEIERIIKEFGFNFSPIPTIDFDIEEFKYDPEAIYCTRFGCDKDFDAWEKETVQMEEDASLHKHRYGGGHIHASIKDSKILKNSPVPAIKAVSFTAGNYITSISPYPELDYIRTYRYGRPGRFRPQKYPDGCFGIEYRTPSNAWTSIKDELIIDEIEYWIKIGIERVLMNPEILDILTMEIREQTFEAILKCNQALAKQNLQFIKDVLHI
ncbi:MAG TPA: hypothetical protein DEG71_07265 [Clostridiales bacterium]|nr:hypothetical protein [Clostridiales bacterium]